MKVIFTHKNGRTQEMDEKAAKLLSKVKRGTYQTRDMVAESLVQSVVIPEYSPPNIPPAEPAQLDTDTEARDRVLDQITQSVNTEIDSSGTAWNADIHTATKIRNQDGTWRKKPGAKVETAPEGDDHQ